MSYDIFSPDNASSDIIRERGGDPNLHGLKFTPSELYFGALVVGEDPLERTFKVTNIGKKTIRIDSVTLEQDSFQFELVGTAPHTLRGGESFQLAAHYRSNEIGLMVATIIVRTSDGNYVLGLSGRVLNSLLIESITGDFYAKLNEEFIARTSADEAISQHILTLEADLGDEISSKILIEQTARTTQYDTMAQTIEDLTSEFNTATTSLGAEIDQERTTRANALQAEADARDALSASLTGSLSQTQATIDDERTARVTQLGALTLRTQTLEASYDDLNDTVDARVDAKISSVETAYATADQALGSRIDTITTRMGAAEASVTTESQARVTQDQALGSRIDTVSAGIGAQVQVALQATQDLKTQISDARINFNAIAGTNRAELSITSNSYTGSAISLTANQLNFTTVDGNGRLGGFQVDGSGIRITGDLRAGAGRIIFNNGAVMRVLGTGFGTSNQFISWFGPSMDMSQCWEGNAISYEKVNGDAYFGGALSAGVLATSAATSDTSASAVAETAVFGSNGGTITIVASYSYTSNQNASYAATTAGASQWDSAASANGMTVSNGVGHGAGSDPGGFQLGLYRSINGGGYVRVATLAGTGSWQADGQRPIPGDGTGNITFRDTAGGSITYTDPDHVAQNRQYKLVMEARNPKYAATVTQRLSINTRE